jgi:CBS domain-containing membrane protein
MSQQSRPANKRDSTQYGHASAGSELERTLAGLLHRLRLRALERHAGRRPALATFTALNACLSIGLIAIIAVVTGTAFVFPSLGSTAFLIFYTPSAPESSPRNTMAGQTLAVVMGYLSLIVTRTPRTGPSGAFEVNWPHVMAAMMSLALTVGLMVLLHVEHPPAAATALLIGLGALQDAPQLVLLLVAVALLVGQAIVINRLAGVRYPLWNPLPAAAVSDQHTEGAHQAPTPDPPPGRGTV